MKLGKYISLFFLCSVVSLCLGIFIGCRMKEAEEVHPMSDKLQMEVPIGRELVSEPMVIRDEPVVEVTAKDDKINADTVYIIAETDLDTGNVVETCTGNSCWRICQIMRQIRH